MRNEDADILGDEPATGATRTVTLALVDRLGFQIVSGRAAQGALLPNENAISGELGIGRGAVREAMKMLAAKGLVEARPRRGTVVTEARHWNILDRDVLRWLRSTTPDRAVMLELLELRRGVEPEAAALAAERADAAAIARIEQGLARMRAAGEGQGDAVEADIAFHEAIIAATGNRFFQPMAAVVRTALSVTVATSNALYNARVGSIPLHADVLDAIRARDPVAARRAMRRVIDNAVEVLARRDADREQA